MVITPKISNDIATPGAQNDSSLLVNSQARRNSEAKNSAAVLEATELAQTQPAAAQTIGADVAVSNDASAGDDIGDAKGADSLMASLTANFLGQPGAAILAQANLSPQSVYDLLH